MGYKAPQEIQVEERLIVETALPDHAYALAPHLRAADLLEARLMYTGAPDMGDILRHSIEASTEAYTISTPDNRLHGIYGHGRWEAGPTQGGLGFVWMVSDDELFQKHAFTITRAARTVIFPMLDEVYGMYGNFVHSKNLVHCRWLLRNGFTRAKGAKFDGEPFSLYLRSK